jgi:Zn-dependent protease with chaperone function
MPGWRRPAAVTLLSLVPLAMLWAFGAARVAAPFGLIGLLFDHPWQYATTAAVVAALSVVLMAVPAVDRAVGGVLLGGREPEPEEQARLRPLMASVGARARVDPARFHVLVSDDDGINAAAGGGRLVFVTRGALRLPDEELAAVLAHELGHHRDGLPVVTALIWWARLPAVPIRAIAQALRLAILRVGARLRPPLGWLALPLELVVLLIQLNLLWLVYAAEIVNAWLGRMSEHRADRHAAEWGYAAPLAAALRTMSRPMTQTRLQRLLDEHPPAASRLQRLEEAAAG